METARRAIGLEGLRFLYLNCPKCGHDNMFLVVLRLSAETDQDYQGRKKSVARAVQGVSNVATTIVVVDPDIWQGGRIRWFGPSR
jgi:hypothetical protein